MKFGFVEKLLLFWNQTITDVSIDMENVLKTTDIWARVVDNR
jgi:hypothetical protein